MRGKGLPAALGLIECWIFLRAYGNFAAGFFAMFALPLKADTDEHGGNVR